MNVALPALQTSLNATIADVQWVVEARAAVDAPREKLAAIESGNPGIRAAVAAAFLSGYRVVQLTVVGLAVLGARTSALLIQNRDIKRA